MAKPNTTAALLATKPRVRIHGQGFAAVMPWGGRVEAAENMPFGMLADAAPSIDPIVSRERAHVVADKLQAAGDKRGIVLALWLAGKSLADVQAFAKENDLPVPTTSGQMTLFVEGHGRTTLRCGGFARGMAVGAVLSWHATQTAPAWGTAAEVHALALELHARHDSKGVAKLLRKIARERFGAKLRVRNQRGTAAGWIDVSVPKDATLADYVAISYLMDDRPCDNTVLRPCGGSQVGDICALAGHPLPEGFKVRPPSWG